ncbi:type III secretion protein [Proteus mirabilis]|uniref:type III secretion protein n=1 Tax=Proteus mirabilis TaxID=584 RepID=UPI0023498FD2|nr:type III secretion protein [Proteus mirabilis]MDC5896081.1 type III secretion protein [Proteus mirabilis]MDC5917216.1 type III secretion protein [Proteus mirabilis]MDC5927732.1 type III secretion protein [Proteus mirabilis]MDC6012725.1 type III secretion protein [Proteus mirabilis]MDC6023294.1 type III secretion protein [Proteus mirabilis]
MVQGISNSNKMTLSSETKESDIPAESYSVNRYLNKCQLTPESIKKLAEQFDILKKIASLKDNIASHNDEQDLQEDKTPENYEGLLLSHRYLLSSGGSKTKKISLDINIKKGFNSLYIGREEKKAQLTDQRINKKISKIDKKESQIDKYKLQPHVGTEEKTVIKDIIRKNNVKTMVNEFLSAKKSSVFPTFVDKKINQQRYIKLAEKIIKKESVNNDNVDLVSSTTKQEEQASVNQRDNNSAYKNIESSMAMPLNNVSKVDIKEESEIYQENLNETNKVVPFPSQVTPIKTVIALPKVAKMVSQLPAWQVIDKKISMLTLPPSITYTFTKWKSRYHQAKIHFIDKQVQLIASSGRVYQTALENLKQYNGGLSIDLTNSHKNKSWYINSINAIYEREDENE